MASPGTPATTWLTDLSLTTKTLLNDCRWRQFSGSHLAAGNGKPWPFRHFFATLIRKYLFLNDL